ncbi:hypothetical protein [Arthrobacter sp. GCM10027362]|uniref:hypothetical protein n=1 Tax=Arthrobacter sp. GCM10027362 TaxID=3273379 RepID=UPI00367015F2
MARRHSRYRTPEGASGPDARGRTPATTALRPLPEVAGRFRHTVAQGERLDQLAYRYYEEPLAWWHICDANPGILSPLALLGHDPVVTVRFPLAVPAGGRPPAWQPVLRALSGIPGVEQATVEESIEYVDRAPEVAERFDRALLVTFNRECTESETLIETIRNAGFSVGEPAGTGQLGRSIVIPPPGRG